MIFNDICGLCFFFSLSLYLSLYIYICNYMYMYVYVYVCRYIHMQLYTFDVFLCWSPCWVDRWESLEGSGPQGNCSDFHHFPSYIVPEVGNAYFMYVVLKTEAEKATGITTRKGLWISILGPHFSHLGLRSHTRTLA